MTPKHDNMRAERGFAQQDPAVVARHRGHPAQRLSQLLVAGLDQAAIQGGGTNTSRPASWQQAASPTFSSGAAGGALTYANIVALIAAVDTANALAGSARLPDQRKSCCEGGDNAPVNGGYVVVIHHSRTLARARSLAIRSRLANLVPLEHNRRCGHQPVGAHLRQLG